MLSLATKDDTLPELPLPIINKILGTGETCSPSALVSSGKAL